MLCQDLMVLYLRLLRAVPRLGDLAFAVCFVFCCLPFTAVFFAARFAFADRAGFAGTLATAKGFSKESFAFLASLAVFPIVLSQSSKKHSMVCCERRT